MSENGSPDTVGTMTDAVEQFDNMVGHIVGINDDRDVVPLLLALKEMWPQVRDSTVPLRPDVLRAVDERARLTGLSRESVVNAILTASERVILERCAREKGADAGTVELLTSGLPDTFDQWKAAQPARGELTSASKTEA